MVQLTLDLDAPSKPIEPVDPHLEAEELPRLTRQCLKILERLQQGPATNTELIAIAQRFGARLHDLKKAGYKIATERSDVEAGIFVYRLES